MLAGELRYAAVWLWIVAVFLVPVGLVLELGRRSHVSATILAGLALVLVCAFGFASVWLWLRFRRPVSSVSSARYVPIVMPSLILVAEAYFIAISVPALQASHWRRGLDSFCILCFSTLWLAWSTISDWRRRYLNLPATVPAYTQRRINQFAEAHAMPPGEERRRALRPLQLSGYVRLGLLGFGFVPVLVLTPAMGTLPAWFASFAIVVSAFFVFHRRFEQF